MNPDMMKMAMAQMANMSPEQMANMRRMAENCNPTQLAEAQKMMGRMSPGQVADMQRQAASSGLGAAPAVPPPQQPPQPSVAATPALKDATKLKEVGNKLHQAANYQAAMKKYSQALDAMRGDTTPAAAALAKACNLNLGACALKTAKYDACVKHCSLVLQHDSNNHKALYRRGQALLESGKIVRAEADLARALRFAPAADRGIMQPTLERARRQLPSSSQASSDSSVTVEDVTNGGPPSSAPSRMPGGSGDVDQMHKYAEMMRDPSFAAMTESMLGSMTQQQLDSMAAAAGAPPIGKEQAMANVRRVKGMTPEQLASSAQQPFIPGPPTSEQLEHSAAQLRANPEMMQQSMDMVRTMSPEQLRQAAAQVGMPNISPEGLTMMQSQMANLNTEDLSRLASQGTAAHAVMSGSLPTQPSSQAAPSPSASTSSDAPLATNPSVQLPAFVSPPTQGAVTSGAMPDAFSPEMMQMASEMMGSMTPDQMAAMASMAGGSGGNPLTMGADGMPQMSPEMMEKMQTPEMMTMAQDMMKNVDPATLVQMMKQTGKDISPEQAQEMQQQLGNLSPRQMWWLMTAATGAQRAAAAVQRGRDYMIGNPLIAAAIIITLVLVLLRWLGIL